MEQKPNTFWKSTLIYGLYMALISIFVSVVIWVGGLIESLGIWGSLVVALISFLITFLLLLYFTKSYRNKELEGYISYGQAFKFGIMVIIFSIIIITLYNLLFYTVIAPDYMENLMAVLQQKTITYMERVGAPESKIDEVIAKFSEIPSLWDNLRKGIIYGIIGGSILSLITAAIVKKKEEPDIQE